MDKQELNSCLKKFYVSCRKQDGSHYKKTSIKAIRAAVDRFLRDKHKKTFSIVTDPEFKGANAVLDAFVKDLRKTGKIAGTVHKKSITREQIHCLFEKGQLGPADSKDPVQLQQTAWFYITCFFGKHGRENQRSLRKDSFTLRVTEGREYYEIDRALPGSLLPTKNHQGGINDDEDESDGRCLLFLIHQGAQ